MTSIANESRKITSLLCGLVAVQQNLFQTQRDAIVAMASPESAILDPTTPQIVIISDDDSIYEENIEHLFFVLSPDIEQTTTETEDNEGSELL